MQRLEKILKELGIFEYVSFYSVTEHYNHYKILFNDAFDDEIITKLKNNCFFIVDNFIYGENERMVIFKEG